MLSTVSGCQPSLARQIWFILILINLLLAFLMIHNPNRIINPDGILYLQTAAAYWKGGWSAAVSSYPWPFYSVLIAYLGYGLHIPLEYAAYAINIIFQIFICVGFVKLTISTSSRDLFAGSKPLLMLLAAFVILAYPTLNAQRDLIVRDFGYWAFSLWGWFYLIKALQTQRCRDACQFTIAMLIASLFRLEGVVMLLLGPFAIFMLTSLPFFERLQLFLKTYSILFVFLIASVIYCVVHPESHVFLGRLIDFKTQFSGIHLIFQTILHAKTAIATYALTALSAEGALTILIGGLIALYFKTLLMTLTPVYSLLTGASIWNRNIPPLEKGIARSAGGFSLVAKPVLSMAIFLNVFITLIFLMQNLFLDKRYIFALCLLLLLWVPRLLQYLYASTKTIFSMVSTVIFLVAVISLHDFGPSKSYIKNAGFWLHQLPASTLVYTNNAQVGFYGLFMLSSRGLTAGSPSAVLPKFILIDHNTQTMIHPKANSYLAFKVDHDEGVFKNQLLQSFGHPVKVFLNEKGDGVLVFCVKTAVVPAKAGPSAVVPAKAGIQKRRLISRSVI